MSDQETTATAAETPSATPAAAAAISQEVIDRIQMEAIAKATEVAERATNDRLSAAARTLRGEPVDEDYNTMVLKKFVNDPINVLQSIEDRVEARANEKLAQFEQKQVQNQREDREVKAAIKTVLGSRPDVITSEEAMTIVDSFYKETASDRPHADRMKDALQKYDLLLERSGAGTAEARAAAASPARSAGNQSNSQAKTVNYAAAKAETLENYKEKRIADYRAKHGGRYPTTLR